MKLSERLKINQDLVRIRSFEIAGQVFRVRVPLSVEAEAIHEKIKAPNEEFVKQKYTELTKALYENKKVLQESSPEIVFGDDDIVVAGKSMMEMARNQAISEVRIVETMKLLVPPDNSKMDDLTYADIEADFPLQTQLALVKKITEIISPTYEESRKN